MTIVRGLSRFLIVAVLAGPLTVLVACALVDWGPDGLPRLTAFPLGLALADPFFVEGARNSLVASALAATLALGLGCLLGRQVAQARSWARKPLTVLALAPAAMPTLYAALGLRNSLDWLAQAFGPGALREAVNLWGTEVAWVLTAVLTGAQWVAWAVVESLRRVGPASISSAHLLGVSSRRTWRDLVWPNVRPAAAGAAAAVFARTLGDPAPPVLLGVRCSLAHQVFSALTVPLAMTRLALLGSVTLGLAVIGWRVIVWWGGRDVQAGPPSTQLGTTIGPGKRGLLGLLALSGLAAPCWLPVLGLALGFGPIRGDTNSALTRAIMDPIVLAALWDSLVLGAIVGPILWALTSVGGPLGFFGRLASLSPPALGIGILLLPHLLTTILIGTPALPYWLDWDPTRSDLFLVWATAASLLPPALMLCKPREWKYNGRSRQALEEAAMLMGLSRAQARGLARPFRLAPAAALASISLLVLLSATAVTPALLLPRTPNGGPFAALALELADSRGPAQQEVALLGSLAFLTNWVALSLVVTRVLDRGPAHLSREGTIPLV